MIVNVTSMFWSLDIYFLVCFFVSIVESYQDAILQISFDLFESFRFEFNDYHCYYTDY